MIAAVGRAIEGAAVVSNKSREALAFSRSRAVTTLGVDTDSAATAVVGTGKFLTTEPRCSVRALALPRSDAKVTKR
jgi:hypothetical protein